MELPVQLNLRDFLNYLASGTLLLAEGVVFYWHFTGLEIVNLSQNSIFELFIFAIIAYSIGISTTGFFSLLVRLTHKEAKSFSEKLSAWILTNIFGLKYKKDARIDLLSSSAPIHTLLLKKIKEKYFIDVKNTDRAEDIKNIFYLSLRYVYNFANPAALFQIDRLHTLMNYNARLGLAYLISFVLSGIAIIISLGWNIGKLSTPTLLTIFVVSLLLIRRSSANFQKHYGQWCQNIWRLFLII